MKAEGVPPAEDIKDEKGGINRERSIDEKTVKTKQTEPKGKSALM